MTAEIVFAEPRIVNTVVYTASDTVTYERLADIVDSVLDWKVRRLEWSVPFLKDELAKDPNNPIKKYRVVFAEGRGGSWEVGKTFDAQQGIEVMSAEQWARENLLLQDLGQVRLDRTLALAKTISVSTKAAPCDSDSSLR